jgi:hypothetical protein
MLSDGLRGKNRFQAIGVGQSAHHLRDGFFCMSFCGCRFCASPSHVCHVTDLCRAYAACVIMAVESVNMTYMMTILPSWYDTM